MKTNLPKTIFTIVVSMLLFASCGSGDEENENAKKLLDHLVECSEMFESCKDLCPPRPTKKQMDQYWSTYNSICPTFPTPPIPPNEPGGQNLPDPLSWYECHLYAANAVFGDQYYDMYCNDRCVEEYYACIFGDEWDGLNLKKPEEFKIK